MSKIHYTCKKVEFISKINIIILARPENDSIELPSEEIEGTIHAKPGSGLTSKVFIFFNYHKNYLKSFEFCVVEILLIRLFQIFTATPVKTLKGEYNVDFT